MSVGQNIRPEFFYGLAASYKYIPQGYPIIWILFFEISQLERFTMVKISPTPV